jgi:hypothetical protein
MSKLHCNDPDYTEGYKQQKTNFDKVKNVFGERLDALSNKLSYDNPNKNNSRCECGNSHTSNSITQPTQPAKHPIVNLCQSYIESVFFQYDSFPMTDGKIAFNNDKKGRIVKFTYFLDSSMGDSVTVWVNKISANNQKESLLNYVAGGNQYIKGTFNNQILEFNLNMPIKNDEQIEIVFENASASDVTIMALADIKYGEEDF